MDKEAGKVFQELKKDLTSYVELKTELLKLNTYERTGKVTAVLSYGLIMVFLILFAILFIFMAIGYFLGDLFDDTALGFVSVFLMYAAIIVYIAWNKGRIMAKIQDEIIDALMTNDDKDKNDEQATNTPGEAPSGETTVEQGVRDPRTQVE